jgi:hypothetical protein
VKCPEGWNRLFDNLASSASNQHSAKNRGKNEAKKGFDKAVTALSNGITLLFATKCLPPGGGMAEGRRQRVAKQIAKIAGIAKIGN